MLPEQERPLANRFGFVPRRLEIEDRPELANFPQNILFLSFTSQAGERYTATAEYQPDLDTYQAEELGQSVTYRNIYGPNATVTITRTPDNWLGVKTINEEEVLRAFGADWQQFFGHFTLNGLSNGEACLFEKIGK